MRIDQAIFKRKSVRKYKMEGINQNVFDKIQEILMDAKGIKPEINCRGYLVRDGARVRKLFDNFISKYIKVNAPHYILITSQEKEGYLENVGFMFERVVLELTTMGIGTCWIGAPFNRKMIKDIINIKDDHIPVCIIALGEPEDFYSMYRSNVNQFKRENIEKLIVKGETEEIKEALECARLAPSGINSQPWRFIVEEDSIHLMCIKRKNMLTKALYEKMNLIDIGIAMNHLEIGLRKNGFKFDISEKNNKYDSKDLKHIAVIKYK